MSKILDYRPDIDGLRAIAVIPVILFHAGFSIFSGGFVGVNIFFVISGYLITKIIYLEIQSGNFSIKNFYQKRIDRLLPVLLAVLVFVIATSFFSSPPEEFQSILESVVSALTFTSNIYFWATSDYFSTSALTIPLLHTWSLGIEEQFYIFFPLFLLLAHSIKKQNTAILFAAFFSLLLSVIAINYSSAATFYLLPFRAWELLLGSVLALGMIPMVDSRKVSNLLSLTGISLIAGSVLLFTKSTKFPGINAIYPTIGAALIIYSGAHPRNLVTKLLSSAPLIVTGKASYSIYMWHWPIFVFYGLLFGYPDSLLEQTLLVGFALFVGFGSWHFIEKRTRGRLSKLSPSRTFSTALLACLPLFIFCGWGILQKGIPQRVSPDVIAIEQMSSDFSPYRAVCHLNDDKTMPYSDACILGDKKQYPRTLVWGDSHGVEIAAALGDVFAGKNQSLRQVTNSSCPPLLDIDKKDRPGCKAHNDKVFSAITQDSALETVIFSMYYPENKKWNEQYSSSLTKTLAALVSAGKKVVLMYPLPETIDGAPTMLARSLMLNRETATSQSTSDFLKSHSIAINLIDNIPNENVFKLKTWQIFCDDYCHLSDSGGAYFFDAHHPSMYGARKIAASIDQSMEYGQNAALAE